MIDLDWEVEIWYDVALYGANTSDVLWDIARTEPFRNMNKSSQGQPLFECQVITLQLDSTIDFHESRIVPTNSRKLKPQNNGSLKSPRVKRTYVIHIRLDWNIF